MHLWQGYRLSARMTFDTRVGHVLAVWIWRFIINKQHDGYWPWPRKINDLRNGVAKCIHRFAYQHAKHLLALQVQQRQQIMILIHCARWITLSQLRQRGFHHTCSLWFKIVNIYVAVEGLWNIQAYVFGGFHNSLFRYKKSVNNPCLAYQCNSQQWVLCTNACVKCYAIPTSKR